MAKLQNKENNIYLNINLLNNNYLDIQLSRQDFENWIPFEFIFNIEGKEYIYEPEMGSTFSLYEVQNLITKFEQISEAKLCKKSFEKFEFSSSECYFDIVVYDPLEDNEIYIELWINIATISNGKSSGFDKGFRFVVTLDSFLQFTNDLKIQLKKIISASNEGILEEL